MQGARGAALEPDSCGDLLRLDERYILDQQADNPVQSFTRQAVFDRASLAPAGDSQFFFQADFIS